MSDVMLIGVLRMPYDLAMSSELSRLQFHSRAKQAADRIESDADRIAELEEVLKAARAQVDLVGQEPFAVSEADAREVIARIDAVLGGDA